MNETHRDKRSCSLKIGAAGGFVAIERSVKKSLNGASVGQRASRRMVSTAVEDDHGASVRPPRLAGLQAATSLAMATHLAAKVS